MKCHEVRWRIVLLVICVVAAIWCGPFALGWAAQDRVVVGMSPARPSTRQSKAAKPTERPLRRGRLYFGAPPVIPHEAGAEMSECLTCHGDKDSGAPLTPHPTRLRCSQCHVPSDDKAGQLRASTFRGLPPPARSPRLHPKAPPLMAHPVLLHENCLSCHDSSARKDIISTSHPQRLRCQQCHVPQRASAGEFRP